MIEVVKDANNAFMSLRQGSLDIYDKLRPPDYAELRSQTGVTQVSDLGPGLPTDYLWFNLNGAELNGRPVVNPVKRAWFNDTRFRQAVSSEIDLQTIASITLQGLATPLHGFVSPGNRKWFAADLPRIAYDMERSRALLREAGFTTRGAKDRPELYDGLDFYHKPVNSRSPKAHDPSWPAAWIRLFGLARSGDTPAVDFVRNIVCSYRSETPIKANFVLRPWRSFLPGIGSARSPPMKNNDDIHSTDTNEIKHLINRVKQGELDQGDAQEPP